MTPGAGAIFDPTGVVGRIYKEDHYTLLHTKYESLVVSEKIFLCFSHEAPRGGAYMDPRGMVGRIMKRTTIYCYSQNMKALGHVVSEKKIFLCFSHCI